jgi:UPF0755 protein
MKKFIIFAIGLLLVFSLFFYNQVSMEHENEFGDKVFTIEAGQGIEDIAKKLKVEGFLSDTFWFKVYVLSSGKKASFFDGEFNLNTKMNIKQLVEAMTTRQAIDMIDEANITLLEGWTIEQMDHYLADTELFEQGELLKYSKKYNKKIHLYLLDRPSDATLEGYLYPDTYRIFKKSTIEEVAEKMLNNFDKKLTDEIRAEIRKQGKTVFEVVTLASIVEREMFGYENRRVVADIFLKRLEIGMALQSDATVNYVTKKGIAAPSYDDIEVDNLYNTYKYPGLPPGPISNPSIEAIKAVVYPAQTDYWYFLNTPDGDIIYGRNHDEHVANKFKYLK